MLLLLLLLWWGCNKHARVSTANVQLTQHLQHGHCSGAQGGARGPGMWQGCDHTFWLHPASQPGLPLTYFDTFERVQRPPASLDRHVQQTVLALSSDAISEANLYSFSSYKQMQESKQVPADMCHSAGRTGHTCRGTCVCSRRALIMA